VLGGDAAVGTVASSGAASKVEKDVTSRFDAVDVDAEMADVVVRTGDSAHVSCTGTKDFSYACHVRGGVLIVTQEARHEHVNSASGKIVVTVPRDASLKRVTAESEMGDVTVSGVRATTTDLETEMGDITVAGGDLADVSLDLRETMIKA
jgi:predicted metal-dependent RNase